MSQAPPKAATATNGTSAATTPTNNTPTTNGRTTTKKKPPETAIDPVSMYESVRSRIAALEEEEGIEEEEDNRMGLYGVKSVGNDCCSFSSYLLSIAEQARSAIKGMSDSAIHARYVELVRYIYKCSSIWPSYTMTPQYQQVRRNEREHARERQKLTKDKDTGTYYLEYRRWRHRDLIMTALFTCSIAKSSLTKANQAKTKLENIARELQKAGKRHNV